MAQGQLARDSGPTGPCRGQPSVAEPGDGQLLRRFISRRDEAAFALLVRRHAPMVWGVCRRVLANPHDAEDAFQATFLVLVRKAAAIGRPELLGNWLYGVAYRTARKARAVAARRRAQERQAATMPAHGPSSAVAAHDLREALDRELNRLPEKYRAPLVLCYLEGLTNEEAARRLGWPVGSMSARLSRGRELLRERMNGRQNALPAGLFLTLLIQQAGPSAVPAAVVEGAIQAAAGTIPPAVAALAQAVVGAMNAAWWRALIAAILIGAALLLSGGGVAYMAVNGEWPGAGGGAGCAGH